MAIKLVEALTMVALSSYGGKTKRTSLKWYLLRKEIHQHVARIFDFLHHGKTLVIDSLEMWISSVRLNSSELSKFDNVVIEFDGLFENAYHVKSSMFSTSKLQVYIQINMIIETWSDTLLLSHTCWQLVRQLVILSGSHIYERSERRQSRWFFFNQGV